MYLCSSRPFRGQIDISWITCWMRFSASRPRKSARLCTRPPSWINYPRHCAMRSSTSQAARLTWTSWSAPICFSSLLMRSSNGIAITISLPSFYASRSSNSVRSGFLNCTGVPATGLPRIICPLKRSAMPWLPEILTGFIKPSPETPLQCLKTQSFLMCCGISMNCPVNNFHPIPGFAWHTPGQKLMLTQRLAWLSSCRRLKGSLTTWRKSRKEDTYAATWRRSRHIWHG